MMSALTAGEIQLYQGGAEGLIRLVSGGGDGIFIASQYNFVGHYVLMTDPGIMRLEDLRGQRIALDPTSPTYGYMLKALEKAGVRKEDVTFVQFGTAGQPERTMAVLRKQAAATILTAPNTYAAEKQGLRRFSVIRDLGIRQLITVTGTSKRFLREKRETAEAFLRGYVEGLAYVKAHKDLTMKVIGKYTRQRDPEVLEKFYEELVPDLPQIPYVEEASMRATVEAMQILGPPLPKVEPKTLYDNSFLKTLETAAFLDKIKLH
jgi:NitT/TauT family transport system substrate-binding protein